MLEIIVNSGTTGTGSTQPSSQSSNIGLIPPSISTLGKGVRLEAVVARQDSNGNLVLKTSGGEFTVSSQLKLPVGTKVTLEVISNQQSQQQNINSANVFQAKITTIDGKPLSSYNFTVQQSAEAGKQTQQGKHNSANPVSTANAANSATQNTSGNVKPVNLQNLPQNFDIVKLAPQSDNQQVQTSTQIKQATTAATSQHAQQSVKVDNPALLNLARGGIVNAQVLSTSPESRQILSRIAGSQSQVYGQQATGQQPIEKVGGSLILAQNTNISIKQSDIITFRVNSINLPQNTQQTGQATQSGNQTQPGQQTQVQTQSGQAQTSAASTVLNHGHISSQVQAYQQAQQNIGTPQQQLQIQGQAQGQVQGQNSQANQTGVAQQQPASNNPVSSAANTVSNNPAGGVTQSQVSTNNQSVATSPGTQQPASAVSSTAASTGTGATAATTSLSNTLTASVIGADTGNTAVLKTPLGTMRITPPTPLPTGTQMQLEPISVQSTQKQDPTIINEQLKLLAIYKNTLDTITQVVKNAEPFAFDKILRQMFPNPGNTNFSGKMLHQMRSMMAGGEHFALNAQVKSILREEGRADLVTQLSRDFGNLKQTTNELPNNWNSNIFTTFDGKELQYGSFYYKNYKNKGGQEQDSEATRFIVELNLSELGEYQLDGFIKNAENADNREFNLEIRTTSQVNEEMQKDITRIFTDTLEATGITGVLKFKVENQLPPLPFHENFNEGEIFA